MVPGATSCHAVRKVLPELPSHLPMVVYSSANLTSDIMKGLLKFFTEDDIGAMGQHRETLHSALRALDGPGPSSGTSGCAYLICLPHQISQTAQRMVPPIITCTPSL